MNDGNDHENPFRLTLIREKKQTTNQSPRRTGLTDHAKRPPSSPVYRQLIIDNRRCSVTSGIPRLTGGRRHAWPSPKIG